MSYKPKHCNECGEKIERADWGFTTSRRFCDLCGTNFGYLDWIPRIAVCAAIVLAVALIGLSFRKPQKDLVISSVQTPPNNSANDSGNFVSQTNSARNANQANVPPANVNAQTQQSKPAAFSNAPLKSIEKTNPPQTQPASATTEEAVYFCGAQTKKGTPCTRRVRGGGRCWQHAGQAAILPAGKLVAN